MIAALSIHQYQIKCSEEIMVNAPSSFLEPQKTEEKKEQYMSVLVIEVLSPKQINNNKRKNRKHPESWVLKMFHLALQGICNIK